MKLRTRTPPSSPLKLNSNLLLSSPNNTRSQQPSVFQRKYEESSDWSSSSPLNEAFSSPLNEASSSRPYTSSISPKRTSNRLTNSTIQAPSPIRVATKPITIDSSSTSSESEEDSTGESDNNSQIKSNFGKRPLIVNESSSDISTSETDDMSETAPTDNADEMVDIISDQTDFNEITDPSLHGLLEDGEIDLERAVIEEHDRKLFESAFNRVELLNNTNSNTNSIDSSYGGIFKNRARSAGSSTSKSSTTVRGKGKDLFSVLKQRARGPTVPSIRKIYFGTDVAINPWYSAPYPSEYHSESGELWICEFCLQYMKRPCTAQRHLLKCHGKLPPGDEIYRDPVAGISVFEINGRDSTLYCQNLCLLAKMFLDHKTLYYDVDPFLFYVLVEWRALGTGRYLNSFVGYFSKEKINPAGFNVSCILTMPHHQRKGYGSFLIDFSYLLSRREGRLGSPEKPLSDLGLFSYVSYWKGKLLSYFSNLLPSDLSSIDTPIVPNIDKICTSTGMTENDVLSTLEYLRMLRFDIIPDPCDPSRQALQASILIDKAAIEIYRAKYSCKPQLIAREEYLRWHPFKCTK